MTMQTPEWRTARMVTRDSFLWVRNGSGFPRAQHEEAETADHADAYGVDQGMPDLDGRGLTTTVLATAKPRKRYASNG
jgi:hypothetical protein